jgi:biotin synthase
MALQPAAGARDLNPREVDGNRRLSDQLAEVYRLWGYEEVAPPAIERLETLARVRRSGITLCCGGIIGMGEGPSDRAGLLEVLANIEPHPESVPINALVAVEGTPLEHQQAVDPLDLVRMVAAARILMPHSRVRLSAGREQMNREAQILCLLAGADSIFYGETLLTTGNPDVAADRELLAAAGVSVSR